MTGGRNGFGAKLTNIYSTEFRVETVSHGKRFVQVVVSSPSPQVFHNHMEIADPPQISDAPNTPDFTEIRFRPDFALFGLKGLDADCIALLRRRVLDIAGVSDGKIQTYFNGERQPIRDFKQFVAAFAVTPVFPPSVEVASNSSRGGNRIRRIPAVDLRRGADACRGRFSSQCTKIGGNSGGEFRQRNLDFPRGPSRDAPGGAAGRGDPALAGEATETPGETVGDSPEFVGILQLPDREPEFRHADEGVSHHPREGGSPAVLPSRPSGVPRGCRSRCVRRW